MKLILIGDANVQFWLFFHKLTKTFANSLAALNKQPSRAVTKKGVVGTSLLIDIVYSKVVVWQ